MGNEWQRGAAGEPEAKRGLGHLAGEISARIGRAGQSLRAVLRSGGEGLSGRLITLGELLLDATMSPLGRFIVAAAAVTGAWVLLSL
jgi:hypothetical protein